MICPNCNYNGVQTQEGYETIFRCPKCNRVGTEEDFK